MIDAKSPCTGGHSARVGSYADAVAARIGIPADERRALRRAAILHDIGKLAVSSRVLEKPGKLDAEEWEAMRSHALQTTEILSRIGPFRALAVIAGSHHERLDGRGYPLGLDATLLAPETRVITVCDYYDALTADRSYRAAMPPEQAFAIMAGEVGSAIDGECFAALQAAIAAGEGALALPALPATLSAAC